MCNACGFLCCASDVFDSCGCDHCSCADCHACMMCGERDCAGDCANEDDQFDEFIETMREGSPLAFVHAGEAGPHKTPLASPPIGGRAA